MIFFITTTAAKSQRGGVQIRPIPLIKTVKNTIKDSLPNTSAKMKTSVWSNSLKTLTALAKVYN